MVLFLIFSKFFFLLKLIASDEDSDSKIHVEIQFDPRSFEPKKKKNKKKKRKRN